MNAKISARYLPILNKLDKKEPIDNTDIANLLVALIHEVSTKIPDYAPVKRQLPSSPAMDEAIKKAFADAIKKCESDAKLLKKSKKRP